MIRTASLVLILAGCFCLAVAQEDSPSRIDLRFSGDPAEIALETAARNLGLRLDVGEESALALDMPVWLHAEQAEPDRAARLLSIATGYRVSIVQERLVVRERGEPPRHFRTRGYDVSVAAGRFVEYVDEYGEPATPTGERQKRIQWTASEHLSHMIGFVAWSALGLELEGSVVGDRVLLTADDRTHGQIEEFMRLLISDSGGESADMQAERDLLGKLATAETTLQVENAPIASVLASLCREARVAFVVDAAIAADFDQLHVDHAGNGSAASQIEALFEREYQGASAGVANGAVHFKAAGGEGSCGYRVFELSELLKRTAAAYARQRTQPDREEGFDEDLRQAGGVYVIVRALAREIDQQNRNAEIKCYGTRLVVSGAAADVDAAETILRAMGWEPPQDTAE